jgi:L-lactate dehydrogenase complex protein LldE
MLKHYPELFRGDPNWQRARAPSPPRPGASLSGRCTRRHPGRGAARCDRGALPIPARGCAGSACTISRGRCCALGRGGRLPKYGTPMCVALRRHLLREISRHLNAIVAKKVANVAHHRRRPAARRRPRLSHMNMAGKLQREGRRIEVRHVAEVLAGMTRNPRSVCRPGWRH